MVYISAFRNKTMSFSQTGCLRTQHEWVTSFLPSKTNIYVNSCILPLVKQKTITKTFSIKESPVNWTLSKLSLIFGNIRGSSKVPKEKTDNVSGNERKNSPVCGAQIESSPSCVIWYGSDEGANTDTAHTGARIHIYSLLLEKQYFHKGNLDKSIQRGEQTTF